MAGGSSGDGLSPFQVLLHKRTLQNHAIMVQYAIILCVFMGIFVLFHLSRLFAQKIGLATKLSGVTKPFVLVSRVIRRVSVRKVPALPSMGHAILAIAYVVVNIVLSVAYLDTKTFPYVTAVGARTGWLAIANMVLVIFLGMKNTLLGYFSAWSYERLNILHQISGYVAMALTIVHAATYSSYFIQKNDSARLRTHEEIYGIASGFTFLTVVLAGAFVRFWSYELFYVLHVSFFAISMVLVALHQPEWTTKVIVVTILGGAIWLGDRLVRLVRVVVYSFNNTATIYPLPHGGTRIVLKKAPFLASSGEHCFLWIPKIRAFEMHPFTIASMDPLEFVINSYDGFTRDLHEHAVRNPGATLKASVDGSYGTFPNPADYDKVVFIAGGSGASFTFGTALNLLKSMRQQGSSKNIVFVWVVKDPARLEWFSNSLATIMRQASGSKISLYVTRTPSGRLLSQVNTVQEDRSRSGTISSMSSTPYTPASEKFDEKLPQNPARVLTRTVSDDPEKSGNESDPVSPVSIGQQHDIHGVAIQYGRPDVSKIIREAVEEMSSSHHILVMGCGPETLMTQVRNSTASNIRTSGPAVELHCEQFGW